MPYRAKHPCGHPGCPELTHGKFCTQHEEDGRRYDHERGSANARGYGKAWRRLRDDYLMAHPRCALCPNHATLVDHIIPKGDGGKDEWGNLQSLCGSCHAKKHPRLKG